MVAAPWITTHTWLKLDFLQPSGSYKDRGASVLATALKREGVRSAVEDSSGNAGASLAAYLGAAGVDLTLFVPSSATAGALRQAHAYGARVDATSATRGEAERRARDAHAAGAVWASHVRSPHFLAGTATLAYELVEDLGGDAPEVVVAPMGHGLLVLAMKAGFDALAAGGVIPVAPRLIGVQAAACSPIADRFRGDPGTVGHGHPASVAVGVSVADPPRAGRVVDAIRETRGDVLSVSEVEIEGARAVLARHGLYVEPTGAVATAGAIQAAERLEAAGRVIVLLTGSGLK
jgi:threonine synthase